MKIILIISIFISINFAQNGKVDEKGLVQKTQTITGQDYITTDDGTIMMYVNIWGHVKNPGTYLVYEGIDLLTLLSLAGGPLPGAQLKKIELIKSNDSKYKKNVINLNEYMDNSDVTIDPHDTIYIKESFSSYILSKTNVFTAILQIVNIVYIVSTI